MLPFLCLMDLMAIYVTTLKPATVLIQKMERAPLTELIAFTV